MRASTATYTRLLDTPLSLRVYCGLAPMDRSDPSSVQAAVDRLRSIGMDEFGLSAEEAEQLTFDVILVSLVSDPILQTDRMLEISMRDASRQRASEER